MKKIIAITASVLVIGGLGFLINWKYVGYFAGLTKDATIELFTNKSEAGHALTKEVQNLSVTKFINTSIVGTGEDGDGGDDDDYVEIIPDVPKKQINHLGTNCDGTELSKLNDPSIITINNKFKGDEFKEEDSFHTTVEKQNKQKCAQYVEVNHLCTALFNENIVKKGKIPDNKKRVKKIKNDTEHDYYSTIWNDLENKKLRNTVPDVTVNTVMQKVIPKESKDKYVNGGDAKVYGCITRAVDAAPYVYNIDSAYLHLRLDYWPTEGENPYLKAFGDEKSYIYVLRFKTNADGCKILTNSDIPTLASGHFAPPCTETGFLSGPTYLIPEYSSGGVIVTEGAIYRLDYWGNETLCAVTYYDETKQKIQFKCICNH